MAPMNSLYRELIAYVDTDLAPIRIAQIIAHHDL